MTILTKHLDKLKNMEYTYKYPRPAVTAKAEWFPLSALPQLAFDHEDIMQDAIILMNNYN